MKRLLTLLLALVGLTAMAVAEDYGIQIGTVKVTSSNYTNISSAGGFSVVTSGTVTYDPETRMLTLSNACISGYHALSFTGNSEGYTLRLAPGTTNMVTATNGPALHTTKPLTISGGGTLVLTSDGHCGIYAEYQSTNDYALSIEGSTVIASGRWGIAGYSEYGTLNIDNSIVSGTGTEGSVCDWKAVTLTGTVFYQPDGAAWNETAHSVCDGEGRTETTTVTYVPSTGSGQEYVPNPALGDLNADGSLTVADVTALVNLVVNSNNGGQQGDQSGEIDGHAYVDLGLPSGTMWATTNIGATNPEDYGDYFAWGETVPYGGTDPSNATNYNYAGTYVKTYFSWNTYKYCMGYSCTLTKYSQGATNEGTTPVGYNGYEDTLMELEPEDDAAYVNWGSNWHIPSGSEQNELIYNCTWTWKTFNGVWGYEGKSKHNDNTIFLPAAGLRYKDSFYSSENKVKAYYWSRRVMYESDMMGSSALEAYVMRFHEEYDAPDVIFEYRDYGFPIRPIRNQ